MEASHSSGKSEKQPKIRKGSFVCLLCINLRTFIITYHFHLFYQSWSWLPKATSTAKLRNVKCRSLTYFQKSIVEKYDRVIDKLGSK